MSDFIPNVTISQFKALKVPELKRLKSCEVYADGIYLFTFINPATDFIRQTADQNGMLSNSQPGFETVEEIKQGDTR